MDGNLITEIHSTPGFPNRVWYRWQFTDGTSVPVRCTNPESAKRAAEHYVRFTPLRTPEQSALFPKGKYHNA